MKKEKIMSDIANILSRSVIEGIDASTVFLFTKVLAYTVCFVNKMEEKDIEALEKRIAETVEKFLEGGEGCQSLRKKL